MLGFLHRFLNSWDETGNPHLSLGKFILSGVPKIPSNPLISAKKVDLVLTTKKKGISFNYRNGGLHREFHRKSKKSLEITRYELRPKNFLVVSFRTSTAWQHKNS